MWCLLSSLLNRSSTTRASGVAAGEPVLPSHTAMGTAFVLPQPPSPEPACDSSSTIFASKADGIVLFLMPLRDCTSGNGNTAGTADPVGRWSRPANHFTLSCSCCCHRTFAEVSASPEEALALSVIERNVNGNTNCGGAESAAAAQRAPHGDDVVDGACSAVQAHADLAGCCSLPTATPHEILLPPCDEKEPEVSVLSASGRRWGCVVPSVERTGRWFGGAVLNSCLPVVHPPFPPAGAAAGRRHRRPATGH